MFPFFLIPADDELSFYDYKIYCACMFTRNVNLAYLRRSMTETNLDRKKWTFSTWFKRGGEVYFLNDTYCLLGTTAPTSYDNIFISSNNYIDIQFSGGSSGRYYTAPLFRDITNWYNLVISVDTTLATAADRVKVYINGVESEFSYSNYVTQDYNGGVGWQQAHYVGRNYSGNYFLGYMAETQLITGQQLLPSSFGESKNNIWIPKKYTGTYGANSFYLDYSNPSHFGEDQSGRGNDFTDYYFTTDNQVIDTPTNNYPVINELALGVTDLLDGNLKADSVLAGLSTMRIPNSGKWYAEYTAAAGTEMVGVGTEKRTVATYLGSDAYGWTYHGSAVKYHIGADGSYGLTFGAGDVIGIAVDSDAKTITMYKNNVSQGIMYSSLPDDLFFGVGQGSGGTLNFGQLGFTYSPPTGFKALCADNISDPLISDSKTGCVTDSALGSAIESNIAAARSSWSAWIDIYKNLSNLESWDVRFSDDPTNSIHFDTDAAKGTKQTLVSGDTYTGVSLRVESGYGVFTTEISHTTGSDTNQAHGLDSAQVGIAKLTNIAGSLYLTHPGLTSNYNIRIDPSPAEAETATQYVSVDNTNITIKSAAPTGTYRVIALMEIEGFSFLGVHTGNNNADGPYTHTGFRTALGLYKNKDDIDNWLFFTKDRLGYNVDNNELHPNTNDIEGTTDFLDFLAYARKIRTIDVELNAVGEKYISIEFAGQPFPWANAR